MSRHITSVVCFAFVLMTSLHVTGQTHDVAQLNRRLTFIKSSVDSDISDIRFQISELKMIAQQIVVDQRNASDRSIIGQLPTLVNGYHVKPIFGSDLKKHIKIGTRVVRGTDWDRGEEDGGGPGTVSKVYTANTVWVKWDKREYQDGYYYYNGYKGKHHLLILADEQ